MFLFKIVSFDKKDLLVESRSFSSFKKEEVTKKDGTLIEYDGLKAIIESELNVLRDTVVKYWNVSKQKIPILELEVHELL